jgi:toxin YoeB
VKVTFSARAWQQYTYWAMTDPKMLRRINRLVREIQHPPFEGAGKPEPLNGNPSGWWSRRVTDEHRLVYRALDDGLEIAQARYRY